MPMILYHVSTRGDLKKICPKKPKESPRKALYLAPDLEEAAYWQSRLDEERGVEHAYVYEVEVSGRHLFYTNGDIPETEVPWELGTKTWMGQVWTFDTLPVKRVSRKKLYR